MKVSKIIADVDYKEPAGVKDCKSGWNMQQVGAKLATLEIVDKGWVGPGKALEEELQAEADFTNGSYKELKSQLSSGTGLKSGMTKTEIELVG